MIFLLQLANQQLTEGSFGISEFYLWRRSRSIVCDLVNFYCKLYLYNVRVLLIFPLKYLNFRSVAREFLEVIQSPACCHYSHRPNIGKNCEKPFAGGRTYRFEVRGRLATNVNITFFVGFEVLNIFHLTIFSKKKQYFPK